MKWGVVVFPGSNCEKDAAHVLKEVLHQDVSLIWHKDSADRLSQFDAIVLPGGFSYGDYLRVGAIARFSEVMQKIKVFADEGKLILGICNGFQVLVECGLLPGALMQNKSLKFICDTVSLSVENRETPFTRLYKEKEAIHLPIAHMDGNYYINAAGLKELESNNQIVLRYNENPNGSVADIAGLCNKRGNVFGLMPHPERRSESSLGGEDGKRMFEGMITQIAG